LISLSVSARSDEIPIPHPQIDNDIAAFFRRQLKSAEVLFHQRKSMRKTELGFRLTISVIVHHFRLALSNNLLT
jgi:hypothetical protein